VTIKLLSKAILHPIGPQSRPILLQPSKPKPLAGPTLELPIVSWVTFSIFMQRVEEANLSLAVQRYNVPIAQAQLRAASVLPDPMLQAGYAGDVSGNGQVSAYSASVAQEFLLGGKIHYRKDNASAALLASSANLSDFLRNLRGQAAEAFIDSLTNDLKAKRKEVTLEHAHQLVELTAGQLQKGGASEDVVMRARIAELEAHSDLAESESDLYQSLGEMGVFMASNHENGLVGAKGDLEGVDQTFSLPQLIARAVNSRSDIIAAEYAVQAFRAQYQLTKAARIPDVTISAGYSHFTRVTNPIDPSPAWEGAGLSLSLPITISALNDGAVQTAYFQEAQAETNLRAVKLQAESDVRKAYQQYLKSVEEVQLFGSELLKDSAKVYELRLFKLQKGQVTLLDVLDAHQSLDHLYMDYYDALSGRAKALVGLEQAAGIWDVDF
jgi:cobalt-zinc-cadmium efflux system outer membrane protein